jgi:hypothetical protein
LRIYRIRCTHTCTRRTDNACACKARPTLRIRMHCRCIAHSCVRRGACAPRAAGKKIGDKGAKDLAAELKDNTTITDLDIRGACSSPPPSHAAVLHTGEGGLRRTARARAAHALAAPTARAPRVPQAIASATRGPRTWPPRSRTTRPSPTWTFTVRAAPLPLTLRSCTPERGACGAPPERAPHTPSPRPRPVRPACRRQ